MTNNYEKILFIVVHAWRESREGEEAKLSGRLKDQVASF